MYLLGFDIGSSSIKASLVDVNSNTEVKTVKSPEQELDMISYQEGWAEQDPELWWYHVCKASGQLLSSTGIDPTEIQSIGISYQMHGLVVVDKNQNALRPAIIWCDSRAVKIGQKAFDTIGSDLCLTKHMNSPGNFTASKLAWVKANEPEIYHSIYKMMLPGDYIAMKLSGTINTTISGLSEGILWDYEEDAISKTILNNYGIDQSLIPEICETIAIQSKVNAQGAAQTGLLEGTTIGYRAGDQPNNALSLGVLKPGQVAATGGTSGVVYGVIDQKKYDQQSRVNNFAHVNYSVDHPTIGVLLCINGTGIAYSHIRKLLGSEHSYEQLEKLASQIDVGSNGMAFLPFGNGAERMLNNVEVGAKYSSVSFNRHGQAHYVRATLEGIAFSFVYGIDIMKDLGLDVSEIIAGDDNMFQSTVFAQTISDLTNSTIKLVKTTGAIGAARASGVAIGSFESIESAMSGLRFVKSYTPHQTTSSLRKAYDKWLNTLNRELTS